MKNSVKRFFLTLCCNYLQVSRCLFCDFFKSAFGKIGAMNTELYKQHIENICNENGIELIVKAGSGRAWRRLKRIRIPEVKSAVTYALALHELGHVLGPKQNGRRLEDEWDAWLWAKRNALCWRKPMKSKMKRCLQSYLQWCQRRRRAWIPPQDHPVWKATG